MSRLAKEIAELLDSANIGVYSTGTPSARTIYTGQLPESVNKGILIIEAPSPPPHDYVDTEYTVLDFWSRASTTREAHELLENVYGYLHRKYGYQTANWNIYFSRALGSIVDVDRDRESGKLFRLSVQFICRNLNNIS